ncbi:helix-turn-helix transcriptional regulator [Nocardioides sp. BP30]|uniref:helix-turn-helix domain-containing protein n=1 Tax=Nocardioides sp. BP30 TaxID=3036374 RepID=UPI002468ED96|nr:helix-turn-helix transcriptional regulator [Nocardioides sp. BP30]WGL50675.1 helix-turn-helix transcriptional regulator [Nocardioides sp. BP30]
MEYFPHGTQTALARAVAAEVRALMAVERISVRELALSAGFRSHNYLAIRLRDEKPLTLDDVEMICAALGEEPTDLLQRAVDQHHARFIEDANRQAEANAVERRRREADEAELSGEAPSLRAVANKGKLEDPGENSI